MAVAKLGAIFLPIFSGYGAEAVAVRLEEGEAKALVTADGTTRRGKVVPMKETADAAVASVPGGRDGGGRSPARRRRADATRSRPHARRVLRLGVRRRASRRPPSTRSIRSSSRTRAGRPGKPKGVVHVHGGFVAKIAEEVGFQADCRSTVTGGDRDDVLFWLTDLGWIMGPWQIFGTLAWGATMFCLRRCARPPRSRPALGHGRAPPDLDPRHLADAGACADGAGRRAGPRPRPVVAARARLDR